MTRLEENTFLLLGAGGMEGMHVRWFRQNMPDAGVTFTNQTDHWSGLMIAGPNARKLLSRVTEEDIANQSFRFLTGKYMELEGAAQAVVIRVSFTGELGYEIYMPSMYQTGLYDALIRHGKDLGLRLAGGHALMSLRLEKSFQSWGLELSSDYGPLDTGMDRFVKVDRDSFIGRAAFLEASKIGPKEHYATFVVDTENTDCVGGEPVFLSGVYAGYITSGGFGHCIGKSLALGYLQCKAYQPTAQYEIEINGNLHPASLLQNSPYDPTGKRMRS